MHRLKISNMSEGTDPLLEETPTINSLDSGVLLRILTLLEPRERATVVPLVSKYWNALNRDEPYRPTHILEGFAQPFRREVLDYFLMDTRRLVKVQLHGKFMPAGPRFFKGEFHDFWSDVEGDKAVDSMRHLLAHLAARAPALKTLIIQPPRPCPDARQLDFLPLLGRLTQLESLAVLNWLYTEEDIPQFCQLGNLCNLQALWLEGMDSLIPSMLNPFYFVGGQDSEDEVQLRAAIKRLTTLTSLRLSDAEPATEIFCCSQAHSTQLRSLKCLYGNLASTAMLAMMTNVRCLWLGYIDDAKIDLGPLAILQELTLDHIIFSGNPVISGATPSLTQLCVHSIAMTMECLGDCLPWPVLRNVGHLTLGVHPAKDHLQGDHLPEFWSALTSLSSLRLAHCQHLPVELDQLPELQTLKITFSRRLSPTWRPKEMERLVKHLPQLSLFHAIIDQPDSEIEVAPDGDADTDDTSETSGLVVTGGIDLASAKEALQRLRLGLKVKVDDAELSEYLRACSNMGHDLHYM